MRRALVALCLLLASGLGASQGSTPQERIERWRETEITVQVADDQGHEVAGAQVEMHQTAHAFVFGGPAAEAPFNAAVHKDHGYVIGSSLADFVKVAQHGPVIPDAPPGHTYVKMLDTLAARHKLPQAIALEPPGDAWDAAALPAICDRFSHYARPLQVWVGQPGTTADAAEQVYTALFSSPSVGAILWQEPAALTPEVRQRLQTLIRHRWWSDARGVADASGHFEARLFYGDYGVSVTASDGRRRTRTFSFPANSGPHRVVVVLSRETSLSRPGESLSSR